MLTLRPLLLALVLSTPALAQRGSGSGSGPLPALDRAAVKVLAQRYTSAKQWGLKALVLTSLGKRWHPDGGQLILDSLIGTDVRLKAFAIEALRGCDQGWLKPVASRAIVEELVRLLDSPNALVRKRAAAVLRRIAPFVDGETVESLKAWWRDGSARYVPAAVPGEVKVQGSVEVEFRKLKLAKIARAVELNRTGLDLVIVLDSSASMRRTVKGARRAVGDVVHLLRGLVPGLRLGLVHYKDKDTLAGSAERVCALTEEVTKVEQALGKLGNLGGGDRLEAVDVGIEIAMEKETGWRLTAAKAIIVIGDAPPHQPKLAPMFNLVRHARFGTKDRGKWTFSAIDCGRARDTALIFKRIASLGGGVYHRLDWTDDKSSSALESPLTELLLASALDPTGKGAARRLLRIYREYAAAGLIKR